MLQNKRNEDLKEPVLVKVIIPIYKNNLTESEILSLKRSFEILKQHHFSLICPENLDIQPILNFGKNNTIEVVRFPNEYFKSIEGYNRLMLSDFFYEKFLSVKYILICQTDVFVVKDNLKHWCSMNYDYIGAPWIGSKQNYYKRIIIKMTNTLKKVIGKKLKGYKHLFKVGNGGFSLRNTTKHFNITSKNKELIEYYLKNKPAENYHVEDVFFSLKAPTLDKKFNIPDYITALNFAIDRKPKIALKLNNNKLPFAIHGFDKPKVRGFWKSKLTEITEQI